jgi:hypothetical protein
MEGRNERRETMAGINYSSIGGTIQQTQKVSDLSRNDKFSLLSDLLRDLEFITAFV